MFLLLWVSVYFCVTILQISSKRPGKKRNPAFFYSSFHSCAFIASSPYACVFREKETQQILKPAPALNL